MYGICMYSIPENRNAKNAKILNPRKFSTAQIKVHTVYPSQERYVTCYIFPLRKASTFVKPRKCREGGGTSEASHCTQSLGLVNSCLSVRFGWKKTLIPSEVRTHLTASDTPCTYGSDIIGPRVLFWSVLLYIVDRDGVPMYHLLR